MKKRDLLLLVLTFIFAIILAACGRGGGGSDIPTERDADGYPVYLNLDSRLPVVHEDYTITLRVIANGSANAMDFEEMWSTQYFAEFMNVHFDVEQVRGTLGERKSLMFAAGDLPDIILNFQLTPSELVRHGTVEGQLLALDPFISERLTPDIVRALANHPSGHTKAISPDGHMYTLPFLDDPGDNGEVPRLQVNHTWLNILGLESPRTLDEFIDLLIAFRDNAEILGVPAGETPVPLGGGFEAYNPGFYILNALGYVIERHGHSIGHTPAVRNGQAEIPVGNAEVFPEYLRIMNMMYNEGLISDRFFVLDTTAAGQNLAVGAVGVWPDAVNSVLHTPEEFMQWESVFPLTSAFNPAPIWYRESSSRVGEFAVSAETQHPELIMRWANKFYDIESRILWEGGPLGSPEALGHLGPFLNEDGTDYTMEGSDWPETGFSGYSFVINHRNWVHWMFGAWNQRESVRHYSRSHFGVDPGPVRIDADTSSQRFRNSIATNIRPYVSDGFPTTFYISEATAERMTDLGTVLTPFITEQVAMFISGRRPLNEYNDFLAELESIGLRELEQIHQDIWAAGFRN